MLAELSPLPNRRENVPPPWGDAKRYASEVRKHVDALTQLGVVSEPSNLLVALDIDGTIVNNAQELSPRLVAMADTLREAGAHICITTGRSVPSTLPIVRGLGLMSAWIASANGALIGHYTRSEGYKLVKRFTFDAREAVGRVLEVLPEALFGVEEDPFGYRVSATFPPGELREVRGEAPLEELLDHPVSRVVVREPNLTNDEFHRLVDTIDFPDVEYAIGWRAWLDINPAGTSKAHGLETVCDQLEVSLDNCVALGDGGNDIPLLKIAGYGVAMEIARPEVKAAADNTTLSVDNDGATAVMEALTHVCEI